MHQSIQQSFSVPFQYQIHFTEHIFSTDNVLFANIVRGSRLPKVYFVVDQGVADCHPRLTDQLQAYAKAHQDALSLCGAPLIVPGGEQIKNDHTYFQHILDVVDQLGIDRHSYIVAIGGGALLDMVGMAAAIAHRGVRHIRIPTTVLSQNDSGIGVKNSINAYDKKNFLGTFAPPFAVINDTAFLHTLDDRDWRAGMAEAIKVALIKDADFFYWMEEQAPVLAARGMAPMQHLIYRCAQLHLDHIAGGDPFEMGSSRPLDFGHWAAHKLEQLTQYQLRHGEAVAIGIALDVTYAYRQNMITAQAHQRVISLLHHLGFTLYVPELSQPEVIDGLAEFREHLGGQLTIMLLHDIGQGVEVHTMDEAVIREAVAQLEKMHQGQNTHGHSTDVTL